MDTELQEYFQSVEGGVNIFFFFSTQSFLTFKNIYVHKYFLRD